MWFVGANLFGSWKDQTEEEQRRRYHELGLDSYEHLTRLRLRPTRHAGRVDSLCLVGLRRSLVANWEISVDYGG